MAKKKSPAPAKMGRPVNPAGRAVVVAVSMPQGLAADLGKYAESTKTAKSAVVVDALRAWLKRKKR